MFFDLAPGRLIELLSGRAWSSREIVARVFARMQRLQSEGLGHGDRVFVLYGNKLEFFVDVLAAWHAGASLVPVDSRLTSFEIENLARAVMPRLLLVDSSAGVAAFSGLAALGVKVTDTTAWDVADENHWNAGPIRSQAHMDDEALMLFTSGSTGVPKGVVHTHRSLCARWLALRDILGL
ncbi:MAG: class I adenylate-forming enzyme family protein, partial [Deltaproteobacteria bacterium]|nr:class I adenylate-forming enzyme family protein [Deltaproteobacteria bacterium]